VRVAFFSEARSIYTLVGHKCEIAAAYCGNVASSTEVGETTFVPCNDFLDKSRRN